MYKLYSDRVAFFVIYIKEAHPEDGWVLESNRSEGIAILDPTTEPKRGLVAQVCGTKLALTIPILLDGPDDAIATHYGGWPDRLYLIGKDGRVTFQSGEGPFGFKSEELEAAIELELASA